MRYFFGRQAKYFQDVYLKLESFKFMVFSAIKSNSVVNFVSAKLNMLNDISHELYVGYFRQLISVEGELV